MFASCLVHCTAASVDFANQLLLPRLYSAPGRGFPMEVVLYQVSTFLWLTICAMSVIAQLVSVTVSYK